VDSFADIRAGIVEACAAIGLAAGEHLLTFACRGVPLEDFYREATGADAHLVGERARFERFVEAYRHHYLPACTLTTVPYPGIVELLQALRARQPRPRLAVATTKRTDTAERVVAGTGLAPLLDAVAGSDGIPHKPDPAVLRRAAALAGVALDAAVMVGDTDRDVLAARAAGIPSIAVTWGGFSEEELVALAPDAVARRAADLLAFLG
jgi:HAD superfamily hydrolase (TIGR01509 family)